MPHHASRRLLTGIQPLDEKYLAVIHRVLALQQGAVAAEHLRLRFFFPGATRPIGTQTHGNVDGLANTAPQPPAQLTRPQQNVQQLGPLQVVEVVGGLRNVGRLPRAPRQELPHGLAVGVAGTLVLEAPRALFQLLIASGEEMLAAEGVRLERRGGRPPTA